MVCNRCKMVVKTELERLGLHPIQVELGEVTLQEEQLSPLIVTEIKKSLAKSGFELIDNRKARIIEKIKTIVIDSVHYNNDGKKHKLSAVLSSAIHLDYPYISKLFSEVEGITIEQYAIQQKIEKIKELLVYDELSLSQIADELGYSSSAHLSAQFKKVTGLSPSHFKNIGIHHRKSLDNITKG